MNIRFHEYKKIYDYEKEIHVLHVGELEEHKPLQKDKVQTCQRSICDTYFWCLALL
jgi:hypothetical protein